MKNTVQYCRKLFNTLGTPRHCQDTISMRGETGMKPKNICPKPKMFRLMFFGQKMSTSHYVNYYPHMKYHSIGHGKSKLNNITSYINKINIILHSSSCIGIDHNIVHFTHLAYITLHLTYKYNCT